MTKGRFLRVDVTLRNVSREVFLRKFHLPYEATHAQLDALMLRRFDFHRESFRLTITPQRTFFSQCARILLVRILLVRWRAFQHAVGCTWTFEV